MRASKASLAGPAVVFVRRARSACKLSIAICKRVRVFVGGGVELLIGVVLGRGVVAGGFEVVAAGVVLALGVDAGGFEVVAAGVVLALGVDAGGCEVDGRGAELDGCGVDEVTGAPAQRILSLHTVVFTKAGLTRL